MTAPFDVGQRVTANYKASCPACHSTGLEFRRPGSENGVFGCVSCGESFIRRYGDVTPVTAEQFPPPPDQHDVDHLRELLDLMTRFPDNDQRARYLLTSNWMRLKLGQVDVVRRLGEAEADRRAYEAMDAERRVWESRRCETNVTLAELRRDIADLRERLAETGVETLQAIAKNEAADAAFAED